MLECCYFVYWWYALCKSINFAFNPRSLFLSSSICSMNNAFTSFPFFLQLPLIYDNLYKLLVFLYCANHSVLYCLLSFLGVTAVLVSLASVIIYSMIAGTTLKWCRDSVTLDPVFSVLTCFVFFFLQSCFFSHTVSVTYKALVIPMLNNMNEFYSFLNRSELNFSPH